MNIASIILAGGKGVRLFPLTLKHCKPAVRFGGHYRLIDIPISNSLNSNIRKIFVIGQYLTSELQHHLSQTYQFDPFFPGSLDFLAPEELPNGEQIWFDGTADAVRKNLSMILKTPVDYFLILSGDQLYNINFKKMLEFAIEKKSDLTIACVPVRKQEATRLGLLKISEECDIIDFYEKPMTEELLKKFEMPHDLQRSLKTPSFDEPHYLASMGIYIFKRQTLESLLLEDNRDDFGKHLIPHQLHKGNASAFVYDNYWEDIGTIESFYNANIALTNFPSIGLQTYDEQFPIYSHINHLPGPKIFNTKVIQSIICEGCVIHAEEIKESIVGLRSSIKNGTVIRKSVIMGNNFYMSPAHQTRYLPTRFEIGENCLIEKAIIDEHVYIGNNVRLINEKKISSYDHELFYIRDGIIIIPAGSYIPDGFRL